jgi:hypothetical protein
MDWRSDPQNRDFSELNRLLLIQSDWETDAMEPGIFLIRHDSIDGRREIAAQSHCYLAFVLCTNRHVHTTHWLDRHQLRACMHGVLCTQTQCCFQVARFHSVAISNETNSKWLRRRRYAVSVPRSTKQLTFVLSREEDRLSEQYHKIPITACTGVMFVRNGY